MRVPDGSEGRKTRCPKCSRALRVPAKRRLKPEPVAAAPASPKVSQPSMPDLEIVDDSHVDLVEEIVEEAATTPRSAPTRQEPPDDDVIVIEDEPVAEDDVDVVDEEPSEDEVDVVENEVSLDDEVEVVDLDDFAAVDAGGDPFEETDVPSDIQQDIRAELTKGEKIVWVGRPSMALMMANANIARVIGAVLLVIGVGLLGGFALAAAGPTAIGMGVFGGVMLVFGSVFVFLPTLTKMNAASRSVYVVTNRRALVREHKRQVRSYTIAQLKNMQRKDSSRLKGAGDLVFETERVDRSGPNPLPMTAPTRGPRATTLKVDRGFLMLENVKKVEKLIRETLIDPGLDKVLAE
jgi:hypothetical protein